MKTLTTVLIALMLLAACESEPKAAKFGLKVESVAFLHWDGNTTRPAMAGEGYTHYMVTVRIYGNGVAQEINYVSNGIPAMLSPYSATLVEHFEIADMGWEYAIDKHTGTVNSSRTMTIYPARVADVDVRDGFSMLPENMSGTFTTANVHGHGPYTMNPEHLANHTIQGRITWVGSKRITWSIVADPTGVTVTIDGDAVFHPAP